MAGEEEDFAALVAAGSGCFADQTDPSDAEDGLIAAVLSEAGFSSGGGTLSDRLRVTEGDLAQTREEAYDGLLQDYDDIVAWLEESLEYNHEDSLHLGLRKAMAQSAEGLMRVRDARDALLRADHEAPRLRERLRTLSDEVAASIDECDLYKSRIERRADVLGHMLHGTIASIEAMIADATSEVDYDGLAQDARDAPWYRLYRDHFWSSWAYRKDAVELMLTATQKLAATNPTSEAAVNAAFLDARRLEAEAWSRLRASEQKLEYCLAKMDAMASGAPM